MPSNSRLFVKPFIGGINTELSSVEDAILNTSDELNCTILPEGIRGRRLGFNIERDGKWADINASNRGFSGFCWSNVNKSGINFIVQQTGTLLRFYRDDKPFSMSYVGECDLSNYTHNLSNNNVGAFKYAIGDGKLFVLNKNLYPVRIMYDNNSFISSMFSIFIRDHEGIDDGLEVDYMPLSEATEEDPLKGLDQKHHYNLLNQGWNEDDLVQFSKDKSKWPSNNLQWFLGKDDSGKYNTEKLLQKYFGNTPAPKGHFILNYLNKDRSNVSGIMGLSKHWDDYYSHNWDVEDRSIKSSGIKTQSCDIYVENNSKELKSILIKHNMLRRKSAKKAYDDLWAGKIKYTVYGGYADLSKLTKEELQAFKEADSWNHLGFMYGVRSHYLYIYELFNWDKITEVTEQSDEGASPDNPLIHRIDIDVNEDVTKTYNCFKVVMEFADGNGTSDVRKPIEVKGACHFYFKDDEVPTDISLLPSATEPKTITDITYMPGRLFYLINDTVFFSQIIKESGQGFDKCYQDADPTSEEISDVIPTDGGYVKLNNLGEGRCIESFNRGVLIFGDNIVYGLISPLEKNFTATEYDILELSRAGIIGPRSAVSTDNMIYYWSPLGIFRIGINPQTGSSMIAECITHTTIQEWYDKISNKAKETCNGCFDYVNNRIYWYYSDIDEDEGDLKLNRCLVYDLTYNAFMPFKIEGDAFIADVFKTNNSYEINPTLYVRVNGNRVVADEQPVIAVEEDEDFKRWTAVQHIIADEEGNVSFGDYNSREYKDFDKYGYDSYMVSRPIMFAGFSAFGNAVQDTANDKQVPILQTLFKRTEQNRLEPYNYPIMPLKADNISIVPFRTRTSVSLDNPAGPLEYVRAYIDLSKFEKDIWYVDTYVFGVDADGKRKTIGRKQTNIFYKPVEFINEIIQLTDNKQYVKYEFEVEVFHGKSDTTGAEEVSATFFIRVNDGSAVNKFKYIAESGANIRVRWGWSLTDKSNRWDMVQNGYSPQKDFLHDEYVESRIHVRGRGKAFQVEIRNNDNRDFRLAGMNLLVRSK